MTDESGAVAAPTTGPPLADPSTGVPAPASDGASDGVPAAASAPPSGAAPGAVSVSGLQRSDPRALGGVELTGRLAASDTGIVYAGHLGDQQVAVVMLTEGAELDSYARSRFEQAQQRLRGSAGSAVVAADTDVDIAPWAALPADTWANGLMAAEALLAPVTLADLPPIGMHRGPEFRPHWASRRGAGRWRIWPLPWPSVLGAASRWTFVAAFALVLAIAALALLIAVKIFQNQPPAPPGPGPGPVPLPTPSSPTPSSPKSPTPSTTGPTTSGGQPSPGPTGTTTAPPIV